MSSLLEVIRDDVLKAPNGAPAKAVAEVVGKPYDTLMAELNPTVTTNKLGVQLLIPLMKATGSTAALIHLAEAMGHAVYPLPDPDLSAADLSDSALKAAEDLGAMITEYRAAVKDDGIDRREARRICREGMRCVRTILGMLANVDARAEGNGRSA